MDEFKFRFFPFVGQIVFGFTLVCSGLTIANPALAQKGKPAQAEQNAAAEFFRLIGRLQNTQDPEERIATLEAALKLEPQIKAWPIKISRQLFKGTLQNDLGMTYQERSKGNRSDNLEKAIAAYEASLKVKTRGDLPLDWAQTQYNLAVAYTNRTHGDRADNLEKAIAAYEAALTVRTREAVPLDWAQTQNNLAATYAERIRGDRADNLEKAIAAYEAVLTVFTRGAPPQDWARTQNNLAVAYAHRIRGDRADNLERAITAFEAALTVRTREVVPLDWAQTQTNLGSAYAERIRGNGAENLAKAITAFEAALTVFTREALPLDWAGTQHSLAEAYHNRIRGDRADNLEKAIAAYEAALTVRTREAIPREWATTQNSLANGYADRIRGDRADNLEKAIAGYEAALTVRTREALPLDWAATQNNLAIAFTNRIRGDRTDNIKNAIAAYEAALTVRTREALPLDWAQTQSNLAVAYVHHIRADRADNLEKAIAAYEAVLTVRTREALPYDWAVTQHNLAQAYRNRIRGDRADNLEKAIAAYEAALTVFTREAVPPHHLQTGQLLGSLLIDKRDWHKARVVLTSARAAFLVLFGQGLDEAEARNLIDEAEALFPEAAYAAAQEGDLQDALNLLMEGKGRLMAVALSLQSIDLPPDQRIRLETLRANIRAQTRAMEASQGIERDAALEKLVSLRAALLKIMEGADSAEKSAGVALTLASKLVPNGGAIVAPIVTKVGGKILIISGRGLKALDMPELTTERLNGLLRGESKEGRKGGWFAAYDINYIADRAEQERHWPEWLGAIRDLGPALWDLVGARLQAELKQSGVNPGSRVIWMPTGALSILPMGLAQDPGSKRRLADDYEIVYAPSLDALTAAQGLIANKTSTSLAVIINPTGDLPGTEKEGSIVASHFAADARARLERDAATPEAVLNALKGKTYWHFASHGMFCWEDVRLSGLIEHGGYREHCNIPMNGEPLTVGRLLETQGLGRPRLVVMSACETGLYDIDRNPDEFIGLPGSFTALGAAGVLGTLWPVDDDATGLLLAKFYEYHMAEGTDPPTALARAQAWLREATNTEIEGYTETLAKQGRLLSQHVAEIKRNISAQGLLRSRNNAAIEWIGEKPGADAARGNADAPAPGPVARPYAHPYFWAGFIYTGL
jgi:CHAT domain-containing protein